MKRCIEAVIRCSWRDDRGMCRINKFAPCPAGRSSKHQDELEAYWFGEPVGQKDNKIIWEAPE